MSETNINKAEQRLQETINTRNIGAGNGDATEYGAQRRNDDVIDAKVNLILAKAEGRQLTSSEVAQIKDLLNHKSQTHAQRMERNQVSRFTINRVKEEDQARLLALLENHANSMRT